MKMGILNGVFALILTSCGVSKSTQQANTASPTPTSSDAALTAFSSNVQPIIDSTCSNSACHGGTQTPNMKQSQASANRTTLKAYLGGSAPYSPDKIFNHISSTSHGGGDQSTNMTRARLKAWTDKET